MKQTKPQEDRGLTPEGGQDGRHLGPDHLKRLLKTHRQGALVRSRASLFMWLFALIALFFHTIETIAFQGVTVAVLFLILMNPPTLWLMKYIHQRRQYEFFSLSTNVLEIIGYTAIIYFLGGFRAAYMVPLYTALITYVGVVAPRRIPLIVATFCSLAFCTMALLEHFGFIPHQNLVLSSYDYNLTVLIVCLLATAGLLYVVAFIAGYTGSVLKRARDTLKEQNIQLKESERLKSEFLANMSHEIRTPMNAVIGFADMLLDTHLDDEQRDHAKLIKESGNTLLSLINDILDLSKIEAGVLDFEEIEFDPELLAYDLCEIIRPKVSSKSIEILCRIADNIPSYVKGDPLRLRQVLTNLMSNATKFTEAGEIELTIQVEEETDSRMKFHAAIRDTGIGIPEEKSSAIFEPFQQGDGSTTRKYGGTGLGLSICKQISRLMGGDVWVESEVGKGSVFHFTAWLGKAEDKEAKRLAPVSFSGRNILIVDDNEANLDILRHVLESIGMRVTALRRPAGVFPTLQAALEGGNPFEVCILDLQMPVISGYDVAKGIRDLGTQFHGLPLVALSSPMDRDARKCEEAGFNGFLTKPIRREELYRMLERIIGESQCTAEKDEVKKERIMTQYSVREDRKHSVRLLLAEDNAFNQKLAVMMLTKAGYQVEIANDGKEAVEKYMDSPEGFDLILMDVQMPELDGFEATKAIRRYEEQAQIKSKKSQGEDEPVANAKDQTQNPQLRALHIPIIAMTAHAMKGDMERCLEAGMDDYISKPIKREFVLEILDKWVLDKRSDVFGPAVKYAASDNR